MHDALGIPPLAFDRYLLRLRLARPVAFPFEHGGVLRGLLSAALGRHRLPPGLLPAACESGRVRFEAGEPYHLGLTLCGDARDLAQALTAGLERLGTRRGRGPAPVLGGNYVVEAVDLLPDVDPAAEAARQGGDIELRLLAPLRVERPAELKRKGAGYLNGDCFPAAWFLERVWRRLFYLAMGRYPDAAERDARMPELPGSIRAEPGHLLWCDLPVRGTLAKGRPYTLGGVRGAVTLRGLDDTWRLALVLGGHLHTGHNTRYGFGRYELAGADAATPFRPARGVLGAAAEPAVLQRALDHVLEGEDDTASPDGEPIPSGPDLERLRRELSEGRYLPSDLRGFVLPKKSGGVRPLAVPSVRDRVAQRAVVEVLTPAIDTLLEDASFAYRRGFSRQGAARAIERAYADGYRYVLDADIHAFFDQVDWSLLLAKLRALYPHEAALELLEGWIQAPVLFDGRRIGRRRGLPQGSPVSPLLANLYLDTFDDALIDSGFRLVRFADDFVVLARDLDEARAAREEAREALAALRLELNADETALRSIDDGFSYLGYLFCRSMVLEQKAKEPAEAAAGAPHPDDIGSGSWLAEVPLARVEQLIGRERQGRRKMVERVPLAAARALSAAGRRPLYLASPDTRVFLRRDTLVARRPDGEEIDVPIAALSHVVLCGRTRATVPVLLGLADRGVPGFFCRASGELYATFGPQGESWPLWLEQARFAADPSHCLAFAAEVVAARLRNLAALAVRFSWRDASTLAAELRQLAGGAVNKTTVEALRGTEGRGAALAFGALAASLPEEWGFRRRQRRPPPDPVNAMLSFGYTLLHNHCSTALVAAGLQPRIGLYHRPRGAHHALASDLVEELRHLAEALVWSLIRRRQVGIEDFRPSPDGRYPALLTADARRVFLDAFERRLVTAFTPEGADEPLTYRAFIASQAGQIRRLVQGESAHYRPLVLSA